jgi:hypothetical protein
MARHPEIELAVKNAKRSLIAISAEIEKRAAELLGSHQILTPLLDDERFCQLMHDRLQQQHIIRSFPD